MVEYNHHLWLNVIIIHGSISSFIIEYHYHSQLNIIITMIIHDSVLSQLIMIKHYNNSLLDIIIIHG